MHGMACTMQQQQQQQQQRRTTEYSTTKTVEVSKPDHKQESLRSECLCLSPVAVILLWLLPGFFSKFQAVVDNEFGVCPLLFHSIAAQGKDIVRQAHD